MLIPMGFWFHGLSCLFREVLFKDFDGRMILLDKSMSKSLSVMVLMSIIFIIKIMLCGLNDELLRYVAFIVVCNMLMENLIILNLCFLYRTEFRWAILLLKEGFSVAAMCYGCTICTVYRCDLDTIMTRLKKNKSTTVHYAKASKHFL